MHKKVWGIALLFALVLFLGNCGPSNRNENILPGTPDPRQADAEGRLVIPLSGDPEGLDPLRNNDENARTVMQFIYQGLVRIDNQLQIVPDLAERWHISPEGTRYTFFLRKDVQWHDGAPFTADDVKYTYDTVLDRATNSPYRQGLLIDGSPVTFSVLDRYTIQVDLPRAYAPLLSRLVLGIVPAHLSNDKKPASDTAVRSIGTGPFIFFDQQKGDRIIVLANKTFYRGVPRLSGIVFSVIPQERDWAGTIAFLNGDIDMADLVPEPPTQNIAPRKYIEYTYPSMQHISIVLNDRSPMFMDRRVRQALAYGIDRARVLDTLYPKRGMLSSAPQALYGWATQSAIKRYPYSPAKARSYLHRAGWVIDPVTNILAKEKQLFTFTLLLDQSVPHGDRAAALITANLKELGIQTVVRSEDPQTVRRLLMTPEGRSSFHAVLWAETIEPDPDQYDRWNSRSVTAGMNYNGYANKKLDALLEKAQRVNDINYRKKLYAKIWKQLAVDQPSIFIGNQLIVRGVGVNVGGYDRPLATGMFPFPEKVFVTK